MNITIQQLGNYYKINFADLQELKDSRLITVLPNGTTCKVGLDQAGLDLYNPDAEIEKIQTDIADLQEKLAQEQSVKADLAAIKN